MKKSDMLPVIAALFVALLVVPIVVMPVQALTPRTSYNSKLAVWTIPQDDMKRNIGVMVLGLSPTTTTIRDVFLSPTCGGEPETVTLGPKLSDEPFYRSSDGTVVTVYYWDNTVYPKVCKVYGEYLTPWGYPGISAKKHAPGSDFLSQHKIIVTLDGVPTTPDAVLCEVIEKEKAKIPPTTDKTPEKRQFPQENIKTTLMDVTNDFVCKYREIKPGIGVLDVYFIGPVLDVYVADHMLIVSVYKTVGSTTFWATDLQDICILKWSMADEYLAVEKFAGEYHWSWDDALGPFASCEEAAFWQLVWNYGGWPWGEN